MPNPLVFESAEELESLFSDFKLLPEENYIFEIAEIEVQKDKTSQYNTTPHDEWKARLKVISFADGSPAYYEDGSEPESGKDIKLTTFIDPTRKGMVPRPSKARKFLTGALGLPTEARIELPGGVEDLIGKRLQGRVIHKKDGKGVVRDRIEDFVALRSRPARKAAAPKTTVDVEADAAALLAKAQETFGEEAKF